MPRSRLGFASPFFFKLIKLCLNTHLVSVCRICFFHHLYSEFQIYFVMKKKKKNQLVLNLLMDFCDQCESTQRGSLGLGSSQLMWLKGNCHWCCFPFLSGQRACGCCRSQNATREGPLLPSSSPTLLLDCGEDRLEERKTAQISRFHCQVDSYLS